MKSETRQAQRSAAPPPPPVAPGAKAGDAAYQYGAPADRLSPGDHRLAAPMGADVTTAKNEPLYAVGLVFMEDKTLGFPRIFVRDVLPGSSAEQNSRLKRGDLLVLADSEDIYGRDLDYVATILPGRYGTFVRLGFANVDRSFIEIDLVRNFPIRPLADQAMGFPPARGFAQPSASSPEDAPGLQGVPRNSNPFAGTQSHYAPPQRSSERGYAGGGGRPSPPPHVSDAPGYLQFGQPDFTPSSHAKAPLLPAGGQAPYARSFEEEWMGKMSNQLNALSVAEGMRPGTGQLMGSPGIDLLDEVLSRQVQMQLNSMSIAAPPRTDHAMALFGSSGARSSLDSGRTSLPHWSSQQNDMAYNAGNAYGSGRLSYRNILA